LSNTDCTQFFFLTKTISEPLKEGHHFNAGQGDKEGKRDNGGKRGIAGLFENLRTNTQVCAADKVDGLSIGRM
jgi:hypothetical protein